MKDQDRTYKVSGIKAEIELEKEKGGPGPKFGPGSVKIELTNFSTFHAELVLVSDGEKFFMRVEDEYHEYPGEELPWSEISGELHSKMLEEFPNHFVYRY